MLINILIFYYTVVLFYILVIYLMRVKGATLQAIILISCPFISLFLLYGMLKKSDGQGDLPDWLLRRERYDDVALRSPNIEAETNIIPFIDALLLNDNKTKRKILIDLLKGESLKNIDALEHALKSDDSETSHYAAAAVQNSKSELMKSMRQLEAYLLDNESDYDALLAYRDVLKQYIRVEFIDKQTRKKYTYLYFQTLDRLIHHSPAKDAVNFKERINAALFLGEHRAAREAAQQFLTFFPECEGAYFSAMHVHFQMRNETEFNEVLGQLRVSDLRLSPAGLNQLRFWLQGDVYEQV